MVAMPYILVNIVLSAISMVLFSLTTAALLIGIPSVKRKLSTRGRRAIVFLAVATILAGLVIAVVNILSRLVEAFFPLHLFETLFSVALLNATLLAYQFLGRRWFRTLPSTPRRLLIGVLSILVVVVPAFALVTAVYALCVIR